MSQDPTKARLIEAAGEEFAAKGFERATIRGISERAGTNIAAVNYHFGDKERLYEAAVIEAHECTKARVDPSAPELPPESRLRSFVHEMLASMLDRGRRNTWHDALMFREMLQPSAACDAVVRDWIRPRFTWLVKTLAELCPSADGRRLHALAFSVVGQCLHYKVARPISTRLIGDDEYDRLDVEYLTEHIATTILAAVAAFEAEGEDGRRLGGVARCSGSR